jgi:predicted amidohydrolase
LATAVAASQRRHVILVFLAATSVTEVDAGTLTDRVKVAAVAFDPAWGDLDGNIARMVAGIEKVAEQGVRLAVLPETATTGYIFDSFAMVKPYLDTVPGKATEALEKITRTHHMYVSVGLAEIEPASGLAYNTAALIGPNGYIGKYRKHGLNAQDQLWATAAISFSGFRYRDRTHLATDLLRRHVLAVCPAGRAGRCRHHRLV